MEDTDQSDYGPTWFSRVTPPPPPRNSLNYEIDVDVCVIGGGLAGLTVAREIVRRGWSVALLEGARIAWNASGRNNGLVTAGFPAAIEKIVERIGLPAAQALWKLSEDGVRCVEDTITELGLSGIVQGRGWLEASKIDDREAALGRVRLLTEEFGVEAEPWSLEQVRDVLRTDQYFGAIHYPNAFQINPLAYALALADAVERAGAFVFENTPALTIDPAGVRKRVNTPEGRVRAGRVVLAGNVHLGDVSKKVSATLVPVIAYTAVTKPLGSRLESVITYPGMVTDSRYGNYSYRVIDGDRLMWTGGASIRERSTRGMARRLARAIRTTYPDLGPVAFEDFWWGTMGYAVHRMPQIGEVQPGLWLTSGFGGHGINTSAIAGQLIARAMVESDTTWETFLPYELVWAGGKAGRALIQALLSWRHVSETVAANLARRREALRYKREREAAGEEPTEFIRRPAYRVIKAVRRPDRPRGPNDAPIDAPGALPHRKGPAQMRDSEEKV